MREWRRMGGSVERENVPLKSVQARAKYTYRNLSASVFDYNYNFQQSFPKRFAVYYHPCTNFRPHRFLVFLPMVNIAIFFCLLVISTNAGKTFMPKIQISMLLEEVTSKEAREIRRKQASPTVVLRGPRAGLDSDAESESELDSQSNAPRNGTTSSEDFDDSTSDLIKSSVSIAPKSDDYDATETTTTAPEDFIEPETPTSSRPMLLSEFANHLASGIRDKTETTTQPLPDFPTPKPSVFTSPPDDETFPFMVTAAKVCANLKMTFEKTDSRTSFVVIYHLNNGESCVFCWKRYEKLGDQGLIFTEQQLRTFPECVEPCSVSDNQFILGDIKNRNDRDHGEEEWIVPNLQQEIFWQYSTEITLFSDLFLFLFSNMETRNLSLFYVQVCWEWKLRHIVHSLWLTVTEQLEFVVVVMTRSYRGSDGLLCCWIFQLLQKD